MRVYNCHIYKLYPPKNSLRTQPMLQSTHAHLHDASSTVNPKSTPIISVQYMGNSFKTKAIFFNQKNKGNFFQPKYQFIICAKILQEGSVQV